MLMEFTDFTMFLQQLDTAGLIKQEWIFEDLVVMLGGNIMWN